MEDKQKQRTKADKWTYFGIVIGGILGVFGFWVYDSVIFILFAFIGGVLGLVAGFVIDKKEEAERKRKLFENKS